MRRQILLAAVLALVPPYVYAQSGALKAYVPNTDIVQDRPFWLIIEASGATVELLDLPECDGVVINTASPQQSTRLSIGGGVQQQEIRISFPVIAIRTGAVTIPPIQARINGTVVQTEPIVLDAKPAPPGATADFPVRAWVEDTNVVAGRPFWIYVEARGIQIELPDMIEIEGLTVDPVNIHRSVSSSFNREGQQLTVKRGYLAIAANEGPLTIPPIEVKVTGRLVKTEPIELTVSRSPTQLASPQAPATEAQLTEDDLVFIRMFTDKTTVYQGEPIVLTMQLWRIQNRRVTAGPFRGSLITGPTTEGFFTRELEPTQYEAKNGPWTYEVTETRRLLYPTRAGTLRVGTWHWEGIALINRQSVTQRDKLHYRFDAGPIDVTVTPLPPAPGGFTGAVGTFEASAEISSSVGTQGVPVALVVHVRGFGNPDAVGDPVIPPMGWAATREPERRVEFAIVPERTEPRMDKRFMYTVTPLQAGRMEIPAFSFTYFDPQKAQYQTQPLGPFALDVLASGEDNAHMVASPDIPIPERRVEILAEDIRPLMQRPAELARARDGAGPGVLLGFLSPVMAYAAVRIIMGKRQRAAANVGLARSQRAKSSALRRLRDVGGSREPADALFRTVVAFVSDKLNLDEVGLTSGDVRSALERGMVPQDLTDRLVQILRACERARYASQRLTRDEVTALLSAAEACMNALDDHRRRGRRR